jgi:hypothetical protein
MDGYPFLGCKIPDDGILHSYRYKESQMQKALAKLEGV